MALIKRGKVWHLNISRKGMKPIRRSTEVTNKKLAEQIHAKVLTQIAEGKWLDVDKGKNTTFKVLLEKHLLEHSSKNEPSSEKRDVNSSKHLIPYFGEYMLADISPSLISDYKNLRYQEGVAPATINRELALMKCAYNLAINQWELATVNPVKKGLMEKEDNARDRWIDYEEEGRLLEPCPDWLSELVIFAVEMGMREEEILSLKISRVDFSRGKRGVVTVMDSKNGEKRTLPLTSTAEKLLKAKFKLRRLNCNYVFPSSVGTKIDQGNLRRAFSKARERAGIDDLTFHDLRHTYATRQVQGGTDLYKVQMLLGHKTPQMTQRYAHHSTDSLADTIDVLDCQREKFNTNLTQSESHQKERGNA